MKEFIPVIAVAIGGMIGGLLGLLAYIGSILGFWIIASGSPAGFLSMIIFGVLIGALPGGLIGLLLMRRSLRQEQH